MRSRLWLRLLAPLALAASMAYVSGRPELPGGIDLPSPLDKLVHFVAYGVLGWLLDWAFQAPGTLPTYRRHGLVFLLGLSFGISDEWHQSFVPGRDASLGDLAADAFGLLAALALASRPLICTRELLPFRWQRGEARRPDPSRPLILVADPHWKDDAFPGLREAAARHPHADWLFLGDLFDVWVGLPGMESPAHHAFLAWVDERRAQGAWVGLWMGNREYFLDRHAARFDLMGEGLGGGLPQEGLAFEHGDLVNPDDRAYRIWNLLSRSGFLWLFFRLLPGAAARSLAARIEAKLRTTNREYKLAFPREAFRLAALAAAPATYITGHFHTDEQEENGRALGWAFEGGFYLWADGKVQLLG